MNEAELKNIWQSYDQKLERLLEINFQQLKTIQIDKAEAGIRSFLRGHVATAVLGIAWILFLAYLEYYMLMMGNMYFTVSIGLIILFNVFAVVAYFRHIHILQKINVEKSITETQRKLALVITSDKQVARILILQTPFYCTFYYNDYMVQHGGALFWTIQIVVVTLLTALAIYVYRKLSPDNLSTPTGKVLNKVFGTAKLQKAVVFLNEIETFKKE